MARSLIHSIGLREGVLVAVVVLVLISFFIRYRRASQREFVRTRERRMAKVVHSARWQLVISVVLLAGVLVYDRVLPLFGSGAQAARSSQSSSYKKIAVKPSTSSSSKQSASSTDKKVSASQSAASSSAKAASAKAASAKAASINAQQASAKVASSAAASSAAVASSKADQAAASSKAAVDPKVKAVAAVQNYYNTHPQAQDTRIDNIGVIQYGSDYRGMPAYQVGLYQNQADGSTVAVHMYFYYADGTIAKGY